MSEGTCGTCKHAIKYAPPSGCKPDLPKRRKPSFGEWLAPSFDWEFSRQTMSLALWTRQQRDADESVQCKRFFEAVKKSKCDWCAEFAKAMETGTAETGTGSVHDSAARSPNGDYND